MNIITGFLLIAVGGALSITACTKIELATIDKNLLSLIDWSARLIMSSVFICTGIIVLFL